MCLESLLNDDYQNARRYKIAEDVTLQALAADRKRGDTNAWINAIDARIAKLNGQIAEISANWEGKIEESEELFERRRSELEGRHLKEREEFAAQWGSPEFLLTFTKPSTQLLQLRQVQRNQALSKDFDAALATKSIADRRQAMEEAESQSRATAVMKVQYQQMVARQARELEAANTHIVQQRVNLQELKEKEIETLRKAIRQLEVKRAGPKPRILAGLDARPGNGDLASPSTRMNLIAYKTGNRTKLSLPEINVAQFMNPSKAQTQQPWRPRTIKRYRSCV
jgi:hypothetical protein